MRSWCHCFRYAELRKFKTKPLECVWRWEAALKGEITTYFCNGYELIQVKASFTFLFSVEALRVPFRPVPLFFGFLFIRVVIPARDRGRAGAWASLRRCFLLWTEAWSFPTSPASPAGPVGCLLGSRVPEARACAFLAGRGALGLLPEAAPCSPPPAVVVQRKVLQAPQSPLLGLFARSSAFKVWLRFGFVRSPSAKPISEISPITWVAPVCAFWCSPASTRCPF